MRAALLSLMLCSCAAARVSPDGAVSAWALGTARVERCTPKPEGGQVCVLVAGGPLSEGLLGSITGLFRALLPAGVSGAS